jgi:RTX calcium-binding nonapeptide repeat (4 copies)
MVFVVSTLFMGTAFSNSMETPYMSNNPSQGLNLGGQPAAYSDTFTALDVMHGADAWITYDTNGREQRGGVKLDSKGWPTELPVVNGVAQAIHANVFYTKIMPAADYIIEWKGEGTLTTYTNYEQIAPNKYRVHFDGDYSKGDNGITVNIESTDPNHTGNYIRDIKVYQEKYSDLVAMGEHFDPKWFQQIDDFRVLRMHDWQGTNFSKVTDFTPNDVTADQAFWIKEGRGMPYELLVEVANQAHSDLWINIPHMATDDYMKKVAAYVKDHLDPSLKIYVEYTNEFWTDGFDQHQYLIDKGKALFGDVPFANAEAYGARASEMTQIFKQVFGNDPRLIPTVTIDHQGFSTGEALKMLTTPDYVAKGGKSPLDAGIKYLATDGYFSWFNTDPATDKMVDGWMTQPDKGYGAARDFLINQIRTDLSPAWAAGHKLADKYGLKFGVYEGGSLLINGNDNATANPKYTNFNEQVQLSAQMKDVYKVAIAEWQKNGNGPFAWYSDTGRWGPWGDYGLWNAPDYKPELRTTAIIDANHKSAPWVTDDPRPASTFDNGLYDAGTAGNDTIKGTPLADRIYGLGGDDKLYGFAGDDVLVGGDGKDTLYGGDGKDVVVGGAGADVMNGGNGFDFASYITSIAAVSVDLTLGKGLSGDALGDKLSNIEGLIGGSGNDTLFGNAQDNWLAGGGGIDLLNGKGGNDRLNGGAGNDTLTGGGGDNIFYISAGQDTVTDWHEGDHIVVPATDWNFGDPTTVKIEQIGADTKLSYVQGSETWVLILQHTSSSTITIADDFLFS